MTPVDRHPGSLKRVCAQLHALHQAQSDRELLQGARGVKKMLAACPPRSFQIVLQRKITLNGSVIDISCCTAYTD
jgi:hypothetical protein